MTGCSMLQLSWVMRAYHASDVGDGPLVVDGGLLGPVVDDHAHRLDLVALSRRERREPAQASRKQRRVHNYPPI